MKTLIRISTFIVLAILIHSCSQEPLQTANETSKQLQEDLDNSRKTDEFGWRCSSMGPFYHMDLYNAGISVSEECRYLHIYDLDQEGDDGEVLHIGYWAIAPNATYIKFVGLDGLHSCVQNRPLRDCSLLETNITYYFEVASSPEPLDGDITHYGFIPQYYGECECG